MGLLAPRGALRASFLVSFITFFLGLEAASASRVPLRARPHPRPRVPPQASSEKPKRPISAMFIFSEEKRKQLQEERPELSESELTRLLARMWNDLSEKKKVGTVPHPSPPSPSPLPLRAPLGISGSPGDAACLCPAARGFTRPQAPQPGDSCPREHHSSGEPSPRGRCRHRCVPLAVPSPSCDPVG